MVNISTALWHHDSTNGGTFITAHWFNVVYRVTKFPWSICRLCSVIVPRFKTPELNKILKIPVRVFQAYLSVFYATRTRCFVRIVLQSISRKGEMHFFYIPDQRQQQQTFMLCCQISIVSSFFSLIS